MSLLLRLLTTGKSLVGLKDDGNRYRLPRHRQLPKFGVTPNPFQRPGEGEKMQPMPETGKLDGQGASAKQPAAGKLPGIVGKPVTWTTKSLSSVNSAAGKVAEAQAPRPTLARIGSWFGREGKRGPSNGVPVQGPVQYELSLDRVQVVRNDLNDTDLELVTPSGKGRVVAASPERVLAQVPARMARATTRLLEALKT